LSEMLRGKQGRFRQNLLGKRVDISGRTVIIKYPELKMDRCGLPKVMALELFKPFVYAGLIERELAPNLRVAKKMVEEGLPEVWDVLEQVVKDRPVLLNRAPTLHRLGILAFYPTLVDGKAIKIHPLVCEAFNADCDGDQMAVHVPLSNKAVEEAKNLILATKNIVSPANGRPVGSPDKDMVIGLHYLSKARCNMKGEGIVFSGLQEVLVAYEHDQVALHARVKVRLDDSSVVDTTVGRVILFNALPKGSDFGWVNKVLNKRDMSKLIERIYQRFGSDATVICMDKIKKLGFFYATDSGVSFSMADLVVPAHKEDIVNKAEKEVRKVEKLYMDGVITNGERYNKVISIWFHATADVANEMSKELEQQNKIAFNNEGAQNVPFNSIFMLLESGARGSKEQIKQLVGMRGPMARPSGEIMETPVKANFKEGLSVFEYFISTHGARKGQADTALKTANSGYLTRRLIDVAQDVVASIYDCRTLGYVEVTSLEESGDVLLPVANRVYGRVAASDLKDPISGELLVKQGEIIGRDHVEKIADSAVTKIQVRSVLSCQAKRGVCVLCYGLDLSKHALADIGTTVGIIAAQSIGEPGTQLTMRTFHIGGTASGVGDSSFIKAKQNGIVQLRNARTVKNGQGQSVVMTRKSTLLVLSSDGRELQRNELEYGTTLLVEDGTPVTVGTKIAEWDNNNRVILTEKPGRVQYVDLVENITMQDRFDEATNKSTKTVLDHKGEKYQPAISILDEAGEEIAQYYLPTGSYLVVADGQKVDVTDVLVKMPRELSKTKDITGGLPRIAELFEARMPKDPAIIADIDGEVVFGGLHRGLRKMTVVNGYESYDYFIPRNKQVNVVSGDRVSAGDLLTSGMPILHDILRILGAEVLQRYLVNQIQEIYLLQGITINDRHIELIVRQMLRKVRIVDQGDTDFLIGDRVDRIHFKAVNEILSAENKKTATAKPTLMGITLASLATESFISAASFQDTTKILSEAAVSRQVDHLYGLKENIIIGKLIPAGTGIRSFREKYLGQDESDLERQARAEEMAQLEGNA